MRAFAQAPSAGSTTRGNGSTFSFGVLAAMLACAAAFLGIGAPAAGAAPEAQPGWALQGSVGSLNVYRAEPLWNLLAIDGNGNVFGANSNEGTVKAYLPDGSLLGEYATSAKNIAIDPTDGSLYQDVLFESEIKRFVSDGQPIPTYTVDPAFSVPVGAGMAVDPATGDLLVADPGAEAVHRYDSTGAPVATISTPSISPGWITTAPDGSFFVAPEGGSDITHLSGDGTLIGTVVGVGSLSGLAFEPNKELLVASVDGKLKTYSLSGSFLSEVSAAGSAFIASGGFEHLYGFAEGPINNFVLATIPGIEAPVVSGITGHGAHFSAEVEPGEADPGPGTPEGSRVHFEYSADGGKNWKKTPDQALDTPGVTTVEADVTGLLANFDYLVRVVAENSLTAHASAAVSFSSAEIAPEVVTLSATDVGESSAALNGTVNASGLPTTYHFEYGTTTAYGLRVPAGIDAVAGTGRINKLFTQKVAGLEPGTTYHYRLVAENEIGEAQGEDRTFTTIAAGATPHRAYEQVTPVDKKGNPLDTGQGFLASADGSKIAYINRGGELSSPLSSFAMSRRGAEDWESGIDLTDPINGNSINPGAILAGTMLAVSSDSTHTFIATNRALTADAVEGGVNLYVKNLATGSYVLVGKNPNTFAILGFISVQTANNFFAAAPDMSWVVFKSPVPLLDGASGEELYRWSEESGLEIISVLPGGGAAGILVGSDKATSYPAVSADGSRVYFTVAFAAEEGVFLHEAGQPTKAVSVSHISGDPATPRPARLLGASKDGRYAFFSSLGGSLTGDAPGVGPDVYRYDADDGSLKYTGAAADGSEFDPIAVSDDGQTAYFRGSTNLLVWRNGAVQEAGPRPIFYGTGTLSEIVASPDGRYLAYEEELPGATDLNGSPGAVYLYDADANQRTCVSCLPDGTLGTGFMPGAERYSGGGRPRAVTNAGQVFFTSPERLVAADTNGTRDVYMFQDGQASLISPGNAPYDAILADISEDGRDVFFSTNQKLVGRDNDDSTDLYNARIGGGFASQNPPAAQECLRDDCKATPGSGPELPFGGSEALSGPGNVTPPKHKKCGKGKRAKKVKGKVRCVKKHKASNNKKGGNR